MNAWTESEDHDLVLYHHCGEPVERIALFLGRTVRAIETRLQKHHGLSPIREKQNRNKWGGRKVRRAREVIDGMERDEALVTLFRRRGEVEAMFVAVMNQSGYESGGVGTPHRSRLRAILADINRTIERLIHDQSPQGIQQRGE